jgi:hypothetical protein
MTWIGVAKGVVVGALALVLTLEASVQEFAELISLSDDARRERFRLPSACSPIISAVKPAAPNASRLTVFVDCLAPPPVSSWSIEPTSRRNE